MNLFVTGGAGYIGSHMSRLLIEKGHTVIVLDNLINGYREAVPAESKLIKGTTHDQNLLAQIFAEHPIDAVIHFAAFKKAGESVQFPGKYFLNNTAGTITLLQAMVDAKIYRLVFSSTAAVYGNPRKLPASETMSISPENPYGESKALVEKMLPWYDKAHGLKSIVLRYFNVAGAWEDGSLGEDPRHVECLIPIVLQTAAGKRQMLKIFGNDYPTSDGTAVRDYIHVLDLVEGHLAALRYLARVNTSETINLGTGKGYSVQEVVEEANAITGKNIPVEVTKRRPGDPAQIWADNSKAKKTLGWRPRFGLSDILNSAWKWQVSHPDGFDS